MYSVFRQKSNYINTPYRLVKRCRNSKPKWDLLVLAICLKLNSADSGIYLRNPKELVNTLHCSYRKAVRLFNQAPCEKTLFHYNPKTKFLVARSFEIGCKTTYSKGRRQKLFRMDDVIVVTKNEDGIISHNQISSQLRDLAIEKMLRLQKPSDDLQRQQRHSETRKPLTQNFIGNCVGLCQATVSRRLRKMEQRKEISITRHPKIIIWDLRYGVVVNDIPNRKPFISGRFACIRDVNEYEILDTSIPYRFKHIVYNHSRRHTDNRIIQYHWQL